VKYCLPGFGSISQGEPFEMIRGAIWFCILFMPAPAFACYGGWGSGSIFLKMALLCLASRAEAAVALGAAGAQFTIALGLGGAPKGAQFAPAAARVSP